MRILASPTPRRLAARASYAVLAAGASKLTTP